VWLFGNSVSRIHYFAAIALLGGTSHSIDCTSREDAARPTPRTVPGSVAVACAQPVPAAPGAQHPAATFRAGFGAPRMLPTQQLEIVAVDLADPCAQLS
jgi:hypothetical protein